MKILLVMFVLFLNTFDGDEPSKPSGLHRVARINAEKKLAHTAYTQNQFEEALKHYTILTDSFKIAEPEVWLNKGHAAFRAENYPVARQAYVEASQTSERKVSSVAWQQLGLLELQKQKKDQAIEMFKKSLLANPGNEEARYNYELALKQKQKEQENQNKDNKKEENKEQYQKKEEENKSKPDQKEEQQKEQKEQDQKDGTDDERGEEEAQEKSKSREEQFKEINISEEKAKMLLDAMKNSEKQYLQQLKKQSTKPKDKSLKDW